MIYFVCPRCGHKKLKIFRQKSPNLRWEGRCIACKFRKIQKYNNDMEHLIAPVDVYGDIIDRAVMILDLPLWGLVSDEILDIKYPQCREQVVSQSLDILSD